MTEKSRVYDSNASKHLTGVPPVRETIDYPTIENNVYVDDFSEAQLQSLRRLRNGIQANYYFEPSQDGLFLEPFPKSLDSGYSRDRRERIELFQKKHMNKEGSVQIFPGTTIKPDGKGIV